MFTCCFQEKPIIEISITMFTKWKSMVIKVSIQMFTKWKSMLQSSKDNGFILVSINKVVLQCFPVIYYVGLPFLYKNSLIHVLEQDMTMYEMSPS